MFVSGMQSWIRIPMMVSTASIAVPTGIKIFSWLATLWRGVLHLDTPMLWALGFLTMFTLGGISGVVLAMVPMDIYVSDTYFIVAHIHYVLFGGSMFTIFAGVYYWFPKMTGRMFDDRLGKVHFWTTFVAFNCTFAPMHLIGLQGMPRRGGPGPRRGGRRGRAVPRRRPADPSAARERDLRRGGPVERPGPGGPRARVHARGGDRGHRRGRGLRPLQRRDGRDRRAAHRR